MVKYLQDDTGEKPADVYIPTWIDGLAAAIDVTITNPTSIDIRDKAATVQGAACLVTLDWITKKKESIVPEDFTLLVANRATTVTSKYTPSLMARRASDEAGGA